MNDSQVDTNILENMPQDIFTELLEYIHPMIPISWDYDKKHQHSKLRIYSFMSYIDNCIDITIQCSIYKISTTLVKFTIDRSCYDNIYYTYDEIRKNYNTPLINITKFLPFIDISNDMLIIDAYPTLIKLHINRIDQQNMIRFNEQFDEMYKWILE